MTVGSAQKVAEQLWLALESCQHRSDEIAAIQSAITEAVDAAVAPKPPAEWIGNAAKGGSLNQLANRKSQDFQSGPKALHLLVLQGFRLIAQNAQTCSNASISALLTDHIAFPGLQASCE